jgi:hypothetical protein
MYAVSTITEFPSYAAKRGISILTGLAVTNPAAEVARITLDFAAYGIPLTVGDIDGPSPPTPIGMAPPATFPKGDAEFATFAKGLLDGPQVIGAAGALDPLYLQVAMEIARRLIARFGPGILDWLIPPTPKPAT